jgi:cytochrome c-type biogenesis protein CcmH/NrfF
MPSILFERYGEGGRYIVYEPPPTTLYVIMALVAVLLAAVVIGGLTAVANRAC